MTGLQRMWPETSVVADPVGPTEVVVHPSLLKEIKPLVYVNTSLVTPIKEEERLNLEQESNHKVLTGKMLIFGVNMTIYMLILIPPINEEEFRMWYI